MNMVYFLGLVIFYCFKSKVKTSKEYSVKKDKHFNLRAINYTLVTKNSNLLGREKYSTIKLMKKKGS